MTPTWPGGEREAKSLAAGAAGEAFRRLLHRSSRLFERRPVLKQSAWKFVTELRHCAINVTHFALPVTGERTWWRRNVPEKAGQLVEGKSHEKD
jgi:hypothetical protein